MINLIVNGEEYLNRKQISEQYPLNYYDLQRWLDKYKPEIEIKTIGSAFFYKRSDVAKCMIKHLRSKALKKALMVS